MLNLPDANFMSSPAERMSPCFSASRTRWCPAELVSSPPQNSDAATSGMAPRSMASIQNVLEAALAFPAFSNSLAWLMNARAFATVLLFFTRSPTS